MYKRDLWEPDAVVTLREIDEMVRTGVLPPQAQAILDDGMRRKERLGFGKARHSE